MTEGNTKPHLVAVPSGRQPKKAQAATIYDKYVKAGKLTDHEVSWGAAFFRKLSDDLLQCGPTFSHSSREANRVANALEDIKRERGI